MPELVVAPSIVMASEIVGTIRAIKLEIETRNSVQKKFFLFESLFPFSQVNSSILSLTGRTQNGVAKRTTINMPKRQNFMIMCPW